MITPNARSKLIVSIDSSGVPTKIIEDANRTISSAGGNQGLLHAQIHVDNGTLVKATRTNVNKVIIHLILVNHVNAT